MTAWPALQFGSFVVPWVASLFVDVPWKYALWGAAVLFELGLVMVRGEALAQHGIDQYQERMDRFRQSEAGRREGRGGQRDVPELREVEVDRQHLDERLGLFMIIVLGEAVAALVLTAARSEWDRAFIGSSVASFVLLVLLWLLTFSYGFASAPGVRLGDLAPRVGLPLHLVTTTGILLLAVGLGEVAATGEHLHGLILWLTCGGLALHALASTVAGLVGGTGRFWLLSCALPTVAFPLVVAAIGSVLDDGLRNPLLIWLLALPLLWQFLYAQRHSELLRIGAMAPVTGE
jgi:low temperature requirement protein LtrA